MKFRAALRDARALHAVCNTIRSFSRKALLKLHATQMRIIALPSEAADGAQLWTSVRTDSLFSDVRIESKNDNSIYCEIPDIGQLVFALKACERSNGVVVKLAKVGSRQLLCVSMQSVAVGHDTVHEVPIRVLTDAEVARIAAPPLEVEVSEVYLPPLQDVAAFVECGKAAGCTSCIFTLKPDSTRLRAPAASRAVHPDDLLVDDVRDAGAAAATGGEATLTLVADGPTMNFEAAFARVTAPAGAALPDAVVQVTVDLRRIARFLAVREVNPTSVTVHLAHRRALVLSAFAGGGTNLIFYLPAVIR
jgi:hypothetical protein